jgi:hypothetical protein
MPLPWYGMIARNFRYHIHKTLFFYAMTDVLPEDGPVKSETCGSLVCVFNILLGICDNLSAFVGWN